VLHRRVASLSVLACLAVVAGCGSSSSSPSSAASSGGGSTTSSAPIKLMLIGQLQASAFAFPDMADGLKAAADSINAAGGVAGRQLSVTACNDQGDPNTAAACARSAVTGKYTAVVGGVSLYFNNILPLLQAAGIPIIASSPLNSDAETSPVSFPIDSNPSQFTAEGISLVKYKNCQKVAVIYTTGATAEVSAKQVVSGVQSAGGQVVKLIGVPATAPDLAPTISTAIGAGAKCFGTALGPAQIVQAVTAIRASSQPNAAIGSTVGSVPLAILKPLGKAATGLIVTNNAYTVNSSAWANAKAAMLKENPKVEIENFGLLAYSAVYVFADLAKQVHGDITATSITQVANKQSAVQAIGYPNTVNWSKPGPVKGAPRLFNTESLLYQIKNGTYSLTSTTPVDASSALSSTSG
jgi:branched-chain amino acid transport system substrate-binding protein